jgi:hypothetical protein
MAVKRYNGTSWDTVAGLGAQGAAATSSSITTWVKTASGGETSLTGSSDSSTTLAYTPGQEQFFINGVLQVRGSDYTATNGTSITGLTALVAGDIATVTTVNAFSVTGAVPLSTVTANGDLIVGTSSGAVGRLGVGSTGQVLTVSGGVPAWATPSAPAFVGCMLRKTADQNILTSTYTAVTFDSEVLDTDAFHNNSTNTERITIPTGKGGKYLITATIHYAANANNTRRNLVTLNGAVGVGTAICDQRTGGFSAAPSEATFVGLYSLSAGDYIQLNAFQDSGTTVAALGFSTAYTYFGVQYLGA